MCDKPKECKCKSEMELVVVTGQGIEVWYCTHCGRCVRTWNITNTEEWYELVT